MHTNTRLEERPGEKWEAQVAFGGVGFDKEFWLVSHSINSKRGADVLILVQTMLVGCLADRSDDSSVDKGRHAEQVVLCR